MLQYCNYGTRTIIIFPSSRSIKPLGQIQQDEKVRRVEILRKLGEKLAKNREKSGVERTTKTGKGAAPKSAKASSAAGGSVHGGFNTLSMSKVESHLRTHTWQFVDLIINCMVIDTYSKYPRNGCLHLNSTLILCFSRGGQFLVFSSCSPLLPLSSLPGRS